MTAMENLIHQRLQIYQKRKKFKRRLRNVEMKVLMLMMK